MTYVAGVRATGKPRTDREGEAKGDLGFRDKGEVKSPISTRRSSREAIETYITTAKKEEPQPQTNAPMTQGKKGGCNDAKKAAPAGACAETAAVTRYGRNATAGCPGHTLHMVGRLRTTRSTGLYHNPQ